MGRTQAQAKKEEALVGEPKKKSGIRLLKQGETLFKVGDSADSLFIVQKGQLRLFLPKGKGFIELAVLKAGEVLGEMAYFGEGESSKRSCSAAALIETEIIEVSFNAFGKTIETLNPWFKTIILTLADRLRAANKKIKQLESNTVSTSGEYHFFRNIDIIKMLSVMYLLVKGHGEKEAEGLLVEFKNMKFYIQEIFGVLDVKFEAFIELLKELELVKLRTGGERQQLTGLVFPDLNIIRNLMGFFFNQRFLSDDKRLKISHRCQTFLEKIIEALYKGEVKGDKPKVLITPILEGFKDRRIGIDATDLQEAIDAGFVEEPVVNNNQLTCVVDKNKLLGSMHAIRFMNSVEKFNKLKAK